MRKQLDFNDVYPDAFPPNRKNGESHEERPSAGCAQARETEQQRPPHSKEYNEQYQNVLAIWYQLYNNVVNGNNTKAWRILSLAMVKEIEILEDIEANE